MFNSLWVLLVCGKHMDHGSYSDFGQGCRLLLLCQLQGFNIFLAYVMDVMVQTSLVRFIFWGKLLFHQIAVNSSRNCGAVHVFEDERHPHRHGIL